MISGSLCKKAIIGEMGAFDLTGKPSLPQKNQQFRLSPFRKLNGLFLHEKGRKTCYDVLIRLKQ